MKNEGAFGIVSALGFGIVSALIATLFFFGERKKVAW